MTVSADRLPSWRGAPAKHAIVEFDRDPILGSGTDQILATAADQKWTVIDMAADWANVNSAS
jgi:hypothetical protein